MHRLGAFFTRPAAVGLLPHLSHSTSVRNTSHKSSETKSSDSHPSSVPPYLPPANWIDGFPYLTKSSYAEAMDLYLAYKKSGSIQSDLLKQALDKLNPNSKNEDELVLQFSILRRLNRPEASTEVLAIAEKILWINPNNRWVLFRATDTLISNGNYQEARRLLDRHRGSLDDVKPKLDAYYRTLSKPKQRRILLLVFVAGCAAIGLSAQCIRSYFQLQDTRAAFGELEKHWEGRDYSKAHASILALLSGERSDQEKVTLLLKKAKIEREKCQFNTALATLKAAQAIHKENTEVALEIQGLKALFLSGKITQLKNDKLRELGYSYSTPRECALFSKSAYLAAASIRPEAETLPEGWKKLPQDSRHHLPQSSYYGAVYVHEERKQLVFAHRGTSGIKDLVEDFAIFLGQAPEYVDQALRFVNQVLSDPKYKTYTKIQTGHSLGALIAEVIATAEPDMYAVTFDSPGALHSLRDYLIQKRGVQNVAQVLAARKAPVTGLLSYPNAINTCQPQLGIKRMVLDLDGRVFYQRLAEIGKVKSKDRLVREGKQVLSKSGGAIGGFFGALVGMAGGHMTDLTLQVLGALTEMSLKNLESHSIEALCTKFNPVTGEPAGTFDIEQWIEGIGMYFRFYDETEGNPWFQGKIDALEAKSPSGTRIKTRLSDNRISLDDFSDLAKTKLLEMNKNMDQETEDPIFKDLNRYFAFDDGVIVLTMDGPFESKEQFRYFFEMKLLEMQRSQ